MSEKSKEKRITLRVPPELHEAFSELAEDERRSLNARILLAMETFDDAERLRQRLLQLPSITAEPQP